MDKRKWLWKRRHSERSPGETDSSGSISSHSERYSDELLEQEEVKNSPNKGTASPEVTSTAEVSDGEVTDSVENLTEKLSAALVNVSMKEDLVKQHAKVAEEAVAGWEQAENEVTILKQQLDAVVQQNLSLDVRASNLDCALKECVRQLRQAKDEQEENINAAVAQKNSELEKVKAELENQLLQLEANLQATIAHPTSIDPDILQKIDFLERENSVLQCELLSRNEELDLKSSGHQTSVNPDILQKMYHLEKENSVLKFELLSRNEELELKTIERDLSTKAAEMASKQQLESIKKVTRLEAECRRLQTIIRKSSAQSDNRSIASSVGSETATDAQPDSVNYFVNGVDAGARKFKLQPGEFGRSRSGSWSSAFIAEFDQFNNERGMEKDLQLSSLKIDMMDDFLEMERLVALPEPHDEKHTVESETCACMSSAEEISTKAELETMIRRLTELEERLITIEKEKAELECDLSDSQDSLQSSQERLTEANIQLDNLQRELTFANEEKDLLSSQLTGMDVEARTLKSIVDSLEIEIQKEKTRSTEMAAKFEELEKELLRKSQEVELQQTANGNSDLKIKQEDLVVAADKLAECQQTIASLGRQLKSLATLEDFLIDTSNLPGFSGNKHLVPVPSAERKSQTHKSLEFKCESDLSRTPGTSSSLSRNGNEGESPTSSSSSTSSAGIVTSAKSRNGFVRLFSRSKSGIQIDSQEGQLDKLYR